MTTIRTIRADELTALLELYTHLHAADEPLPVEASVRAVWQAILAHPGHQVLGAFENNQLLASCVISLIPNLTRGCRPYGVIENVVTHADFRRRGLCRALLAEALSLAWAEGAYKVMLMTGRKDPATLQFYAGSGFDSQGKQAFIARPASPD